MRISSLISPLLLAGALCAQEQDPVLFTVDKTPVYRSEFVYIYEKTNGQQADYSRKSLEEYLDLYTRFKLKVRRARDMRLDTIPALREELETYRRQLADSYLIDREVTEQLLREAYERIKYDVDIAHIQVNAAPNASPEDTLKAYQRLMQARQRLLRGDEFDDVARRYSDDQSAARNGGRIGFVTALFPAGFHELENAAYTLMPGTISQPIRSSAGYHLLLVHGRRPARGQIEAAHIMLRLENQDKDSLQAVIKEIYQELQHGADFGELARARSQDRFTADKGGYIGFFGINRFEKVFEDAAFSLENDGDFTDPFLSSIGWHIIKRISKVDIQPFELEKRRLDALVRKDPRHETARLAMIERIKREVQFKEFPATLQQFIDTLPPEFLTFKWKPSKGANKAPLYQLGAGKTSVFTLGDFHEYLERASRKRLNMGIDSDIALAARELYGDFVNESCMRFEESRLVEKYPDFRYLMREYEEGILLFEATQQEVWNKAAQDSAGLARFFETVKEKYRWDERALASVYRLASQAKERAQEVRDYAAKHDAEQTLAHFNASEQPILAREERLVEKTRNDILIGVPWEAGAMTLARENHRDGSISFSKIERILPPQGKTLDEARGYVVADYQDHLERKWVEQLKKEYKVSVNQKVFESLIKK
jgi:peptidyl-prolyl cis-trans isomerase SurA